MFSKSCQNILFSKVYSTLLFRKDSLSPIYGYGPEAILNLITGWYKFTKISSEPSLIVHREIIQITLGYYSIYSNYIELYYKILYIKENIKLNVIESSGYLLTEREKVQYALLIDVLAFLHLKIIKETVSEQKL
jgi:hypothetical protein